MRVSRKPDADQFQQFLKQLQTEQWLGHERKWWPKYLFHFANIENAVSILKSGELRSRREANKQDDFSDSASPDIIQQTDNHWKDYVRFYLRPRTPTLYKNEGIRPSSRIELHAHCPVPIYFLFNFETMICRKDSLFSYGSLARANTEVFDTGTEFQNMPFQKIYHDERFEPSERDEIIFHRHAEVIVPHRVGLESLEYIWCRSQAEYETLNHLLPDQVWSRWREKVLARKDRNLFFRRWAYVEQVTPDSKQISIAFNQPFDRHDYGPFNISVDILETVTGTVYKWQDTFYVSPENLTLDLSNLRNPDDYTLSIRLDNRLVYQNRYIEYNNPF